MPLQDLAGHSAPRPRQKLIWCEEFDRIIIDNRGRMSSALIAELIGHGCTRSAVVGRARRLGLEKLSRVDPQRSTRPRATPPRHAGFNLDVPWNSEVPPLIDTLIPLEQRRTLLTLGPRDCRWPVGDPQAEGFFFCGAEKAGDESYCAAHCHRALQPPAPRDATAAKNGTRNFHVLPVRAFGPGAAPADRWLRNDTVSHEQPVLVSVVHRRLPHRQR